jgi:hypothetical protein
MQKAKRANSKSTAKSAAIVPADGNVPTADSTAESTAETNPVVEKTPTVKTVISTIGDIHISRPRTKFYFRKFSNSSKATSSNDVNLEQLDLLKEKQKTLTEGSDDYLSNKKKIEELNKLLIRNSYFTPHSIAIICDYVFKDLVKHGFEQVAKSGKKTLDVVHFYDENVKTINSYSIVKNLATYTNFDLTEAKKDKKKAAAETPSQEEPAQQLEQSDNSMSFITYIINGINWYKSVNGLNITIGTRVKKYLSDLIIDLINKLALITRVLINIMNIKTASPDHIKTAVKILLISENTTEQAMSEILSFMDDKLIIFKQSEKNSKDVIEDKESTDDVKEEPVGEKN